MPRRISVLVALLLAIGGLTPRSRADDQRIALPDDVKYVVRVNLPAVLRSTVGEKFFTQNVKSVLLAKFTDSAEDKGLSQEKIIEVLGFDPLEEIQDVVVAASDYESPEESLVVCVRLRKTTGNIEGLLLALPGYNAEDYGGRQIYSIKPEEGIPVFGAIQVDVAGDRTLLMAAQRATVVQMLDSLDAKLVNSKSAKAATFGGDASPMAVVDVFDLPQEVIEQEGPPANIAKIVQSISVQISESDDKVNIATAVVADAEKQAEQLEQMVKGLHAMVGLAASSKTDDEDLIMIHKYLTDLTVTRHGTTVNLSLSLPAADVQKLIEDNLIKD